MIIVYAELEILRDEGSIVLSIDPRRGVLIVGFKPNHTYGANVNTARVRKVKTSTLQYCLTSYSLCGGSVEVCCKAFN